MARRLAGNHKTIVTTDTGSLHLIVIGGHWRNPGRAVMTSLTYVGRIDMRHAFTRCRCTVVASDTGFRRGAVIKHRHQPVGGVMTAIASGSGWNMAAGFARGNHTIMTGCAGAGDLRMIHQRIDRRPGGAGVTRLTNTGGGNVCRPATGGNHTIVAGITTADHLRVIHQWIDRRPGRVDMTGLAQIRGIDMRR